MKFKRFRYNLITLGLVAIIGCCVAFPLVTGGTDDVNQGASIEEPTVPDDPFIDLPIENPDDEEEDYGDDTGSDKFLDMADLDLINYSLDLLYKGKGFSSTYTQSVINDAPAVGKVPQYAVGKITRSGKNSLQENWLYSDYSGPQSEQLKNYYQYFYIDRSAETMTEGTTSAYTVDRKDANKCTYDMSQGKVETMSYADALSKYLLFYGDEFPVSTKRTNTNVFEDKVIGSGTNRYRRIVVSYAVDKLPSNVKDFYASTGQLSNIKYKSLKITYNINLKTGKMMSITRVESMTGTASAIGLKVEVSSTATTTQIFTSVDTEQTIAQPK